MSNLEINNLEAVLKYINSRLSVDDKWLVFSEVNNQWEVYQQKYRERVKVIYETAYLENAIEKLIEGNV